jgi:hypothetical protein
MAATVVVSALGVLAGIQGLFDHVGAKAGVALCLGVVGLALAATAFRYPRGRNRLAIAGGFVAVAICLFISVVAAVVVAVPVVMLAVTSDELRGA